MVGINITLKDGVQARVDELRISDTYAGQLAGTLTVGTRYRMPGVLRKMADLKEGKRKGYYYPEPELVDEAELRGFSKETAGRMRKDTEVGLCLKEQYLAATLHISDSDYCHIIELRWFQTGKELADKPLVELIQDVAGRLSFKDDLFPYCDHVDWLDMY